MKCVTVICYFFPKRYLFSPQENSCFSNNKSKKKLFTFTGRKERVIGDNKQNPSQTEISCQKKRIYVTTL